MPATLNGKPALTATLKMPVVGAWHAKVEASADEATAMASGEPATLVIDGVTFVGTFLRCGIQAGRVRAKLVGGAGKLATEIPAQNYTTGPSVQLILDDILRDCGETLSPDVDPSLLTPVVSTWERLGGPASRALVNLLDEFGLIWRVLADGKLWIGPEQYTATDARFTVVDEDFGLGMIELAPADPDATPPLASLTPGSTVLGQPIRYVVHKLDGQQLRTRAYLDAPDRMLDRYLGGIRNEIHRSRLFPARVASQNPDGTLQVVPDDDTIKGSGLDKVRIRLGVPGSVTVPSGARVRVGFEAGDPTKAFASGFDGTDLTMLNIGGGAAFVSRADRTDAEITALRNDLNDLASKYTAHTHPFGGFAPGGGTAVTGPAPVGAPAYPAGGSTAADKLKSD